jgi:anaerobic selenocysteine-containing dehydrogenase
VRIAPPSSPAPTRPELSGWAGERPCAALADEIFSGNVRALIALGGNPVTGFPDSGRTKAALGSLEVFAVAEIGETATTELATHLIPVTDPLERADLNQNTYRYTPRILDPIGDRWPTWRVVGSLGRHLGVDVLPRGLDPETCTDEEGVAVMAEGARVALAEPRETGTTVLADERAALSWTQEGGGWAHSVLLDGRWQLAPSQLVEQLGELLEAPLAETVLQARRCADSRRPAGQAVRHRASRRRPCI